MSSWICEDVGLVINELRDKFGDRLDYYEGVIEKEGKSDTLEGIIKGINICYDVLDEVADNWTSDEPPAEVLNKVKEKYGDVL